MTKEKDKSKWKDKAILLIDNECNDDKLKPLVKFLRDNYPLIKIETTIDGALNAFRYDDLSVSCIILDIHFGEDEEAGIKLLAEMRKTDPYIPIGMITQYPDRWTYAFKTGQKRATFYCPKRYNSSGVITDAFIKELDKEIKYSIKNAQFLYNRNLMETVNSSYADIYDVKEYAKPGTVAFCYWEDEIVVDLINKYPGENLKILDIACGTGRFEALIARRCDKKNIKKFVGLDFAGKMLIKAKEKLANMGIYVEASNESSNIILKRGFAEMLPFPDGEFDIVICGFGVPSYTKFNLSIPEANRVLKRGGKAVFTVYNKNALFSKVADYFHPSFNDRCPMASWVKFEHFPGCDKEGIYRLVPQGDLAGAFPIQPFSKEEIITLLNRFGFKKEYLNTFPILYSIIPTDLVQTFGNKPKNFCDWAGYKVPDRSKDFSKMINNKKWKKANETNKSFSWGFYQMDVEYAKTIDDGGFFVIVVVEKVKEAEKVHRYDE